MQVARLKSISARHLALALQSLDFIYHLIPTLDRFFVQHVPDRQKIFLGELNVVSCEYSEHVSDIFKKLTSIVEEQIMRRCLESNRLDAATYDSESVSLPTTTISKILDGTCKLHSVLKPVLPASHLQV